MWRPVRARLAVFWALVRNSAARAGSRIQVTQGKACSRSASLESGAVGSPRLAEGGGLENSVPFDFGACVDGPSDPNGNEHFLIHGGPTLGLIQTLDCAYR